MLGDKCVKNIAFIYILRGQAIATGFLLIVHEIPQIACPLNRSNVPIPVWPFYKLMEEGSPGEQVTTLREL